VLGEVRKKSHINFVKIKIFINKLKNNKMEGITQKKFYELYNEMTSYLDSRKERQSYIIDKCNDAKIELYKKYYIKLG
jgi:hypothetical protein